MRTNLVRFPFVKTLDAFDSGYQQLLDKKHVNNQATCHFIEYGENEVILGRPAAGKTHLLVGLKAIEHGCWVLFTTAVNMIATLTKVLAEDKLEDKVKDKLKTYTVTRLLIVDEIGYLPINQGILIQGKLTRQRYGFVARRILPRHRVFPQQTFQRR